MELEGRSILSISGPDAVKFIQGYTTNDSRGLSKAHASQFTVFLTGKGKTIADCIVSVDAAPEGLVTVGPGTPTGGPATTLGGPRLLLDVDKHAAAELTKHLKMYKLRSKVAIEDLSASHAVHAVIPFDPFSVTQGARSDDTTGHRAAVLDMLRHTLTGLPGLGMSAFVDPRSPRLLGLRVVAPRTASLLDSLPFHRSSMTDYSALRMLAGVPEGQETYGLMPLEWNATFLNAVSFDKGCYLGQELIARTHFRGLVRKRVMPAYLTGAGAPPRPAACADPLSASTVRQTDEAMRKHVSLSGGSGHGQGHGPSSRHAVVDRPHSRISHGGHAPSSVVEKGDQPHHRPAVRLPFPWLDRHWRGQVEAGASVVAADPGDKEGRPGKVVGWQPGVNLAMVMLRLDHLAHALPAAPRTEAGGDGGTGSPASEGLVRAQAIAEGSGNAEGEETEEDRVAAYQRVHARAATGNVDLHVGEGSSRHRLVPVLPEFWRHIRHAGIEEAPARTAPG